ncbi:MAG: DUF899 family protein, partial [Gammaproteobacteria bacterium]|nr:DUF899 family protein [Gammaproteobacteria bacterium]
RQRIAEIAELRRQLPLGGKVETDYVFDEVNLQSGEVTQTALADLFSPGKNSLIIYSFMFAPDAELPCPACTCILDSTDAAARHVTQRVNFVVSAKASTDKLLDWARQRGWQRLRLMSSGNNSYNKDYAAETPGGDQIPACNVFVKTPDGIYHFYSAELLYAGLEGHPRHMDLMWPVWNYFDLTPEGRGTDWLPGFDY